MENIITKEDFIQFSNFKKLEKNIQNKYMDIMSKISTEIIDIFKKGKYSISLLLTEKNNIEINIVIDDYKIETYTCDADIMYSEASFLIELRNIKDVLYDTRKLLNSKPVKKNFFQRLWECL